MVGDDCAPRKTRPRPSGETIQPTIARATLGHNLLWRAFALNQQEAIQDLDAALALATETRDQRIETRNWDAEGVLYKIGKVAFGTHKSAASIAKENVPALSATGASAFGVTLRGVKMREIDVLLMTSGDSILRGLTIADRADYACERIMQHLLGVRALIHPEDSRTLIVAQIAEDQRLLAQAGKPLPRGRLTQALRVTDALFGDTGAAHMSAAQSDRLKAAWERVKAGGEDKIRSPRLTTLALYIETLNFAKGLHDCWAKHDLKSFTTLFASGMTIASGLIDLAGAAVKEELKALEDGGAASWSTQRLKLAGGMLSAGAALIGVMWDVGSMNDNVAKERYLLAGLYFGKAALGLGGAGLTLAASYTNSAPLVAKLIKNDTILGAAEAVGGVAARVVGARIFFMTFGAWIGVITFGVQCAIWAQPDDLQAWCEHCAFGESPQDWSVKKELAELENALKAIGIAD